MCTDPNGMSERAMPDSPIQILEYRTELEFELIQTQMAQRPMPRAEVYARGLSASQKVNGAEVRFDKIDLSKINFLRLCDRKLGV
jgi:hypothetical protein